MQWDELIWWRSCYHYQCRCGSQIRCFTDCNRKLWLDSKAEAFSYSCECILRQSCGSNSTIFWIEFANANKKNFWQVYIIPEIKHSGSGCSQPKILRGQTETNVQPVNWNLTFALNSDNLFIICNKRGYIKIYQQEISFLDYS